MKKHRTLIWSSVIAVIIIIILGACFVLSHKNDKKYSLADFGITPLLQADCSSVKNEGGPAEVSVSFNAHNVPALHDAVKALIAKYNGNIMSDSLEINPGQTPDSSSSDNATVTVSFDKAQKEFLTDLAATVKSSGGVESSYSMGDSAGYSPYTTCEDYMRTLSADVLELGVLTNALKNQHSPDNIALLSGAISYSRNNLNSDVDRTNDFFVTKSKPTVSIYIESI